MNGVAPYLGQVPIARTLASSRLGIDWGGIFGDVISAAPDLYRGYQEQEAAEELRKAEEAKAEAEATRLQAEREAAAREAAAGDGAGDKIIGLPKDVVIFGALGLAALGLGIALFKP